MNYASRQKGFLLITAVILIVLVGLIGATLAYMIVGSSRSSTDQADSVKARYLAEAGIGRGKYELFAARNACNSINITNQNLGDGQYSIIGSDYAPSSLATLSGSINSTTAVIPVSTLTGYAPVGQVTIGSEKINYSGTSTSSAVCGGYGQCLTGARRGTSGTVAVSHGSGVAIQQDQCLLTATGAVPTLANPSGREVIYDAYPYSTTGDAWLVGDDQGGELIAQFTGGNWVRATPSSGIPNRDLNAIYMVSKNDIWAVGDRDSGDGLIAHYNGITWSTSGFTNNTPNENLYGVTCVSSNDCWAVGDNYNNDGTIVHYNGSTWSTFSSTLNATPNEDLNDVTCVSANDCWAVGDEDDDADDGVIVHYNGTTWTSVPNSLNITPEENLNGITCTSANNCWAVGNDDDDDPNIVRYNGTTWSTSGFSNSADDVDYNGVTCTSANNCWAVGDSGHIARWNGSSWSDFQDVGSSHLYSVACSDASDCWAVGRNGRTYYFNGSVWSNVSNSLPNRNLRGVAMLERGLVLTDHLWIEEKKKP